MMGKKEKVENFGGMVKIHEKPGKDDEKRVGKIVEGKNP